MGKKSVIDTNSSLVENTMSNKKARDIDTSLLFISNNFS